MISILTTAVFDNEFLCDIKTERIGMNLITGYHEKLRTVVIFEGTTVFLTPSPYAEGVVEIVVDSKYSLNMVSFFKNHTSTVPTHMLLQTYPSTIRNHVSEYRYNSNLFALHISDELEMHVFVEQLMDELNEFTPKYVKGNVDGKC